MGREAVLALVLLSVAALLPEAPGAPAPASCPGDLVPQCRCNSSDYLVSISCRFPPDHNLTSLFAASSPPRPASSLQVQLLDLSGSHLTALPDDLLEPFSAIHSLYLSSNNLTVLPSAVRQHANVTVLKLDHNLLRTFDFSGLSPGLTSLDLAFNGLDTLVSGSGLHAKFHHLNLSNNNLETITEEVCVAAVYMDLSNNRLAGLPKIFDSESLYLDLSGNRLSRLPSHTFHGLHLLDELDISDNALTALEEGSLMGLANLTFLNLARNRLASLTPLLFQHTPALLKLDLSGNQLEQVSPDAFPVGSVLQSLSLAGNRLDQLVPGTFQRLHNLRELDLSRNPRLADVSSLEFPMHLTFLDLSGCGITTVDECQFIAFLDIQHLDLSKNPLRCSCHLAWMAKWLAGRWTRTLSRLRPNDPLPWTCQDKNGVTRRLTADPIVPLEVCDDHSTTGHHCNDGASPPPLLPENTEVNLTLAVEGGTFRVRWDVKATGTIYGFRLQFKAQGDESLFHSPVLQSSERSFTMKNMKADKDVTVCLDILVNSTSAVKSVCTTHDPVSLKLIVGIMAGIIFLVPCTIVLTYILHKDRQLTRAEYLAQGDCMANDGALLSLSEDDQAKGDKTPPGKAPPGKAPSGKAPPGRPGEGQGCLPPPEVKIPLQPQACCNHGHESEIHVNPAFQEELQGREAAAGSGDEGVQDAASGKATQASSGADWNVTHF